MATAKTVGARLLRMGMDLVGATEGLRARDAAPASFGCVAGPGPGLLALEHAHVAPVPFVAPELAAQAARGAPRPELAAQAARGASRLELAASLGRSPPSPAAPLVLPSAPLAPPRPTLRRLRGAGAGGAGSAAAFWRCPRGFPRDIDEAPASPLRPPPLPPTDVLGRTADSGFLCPSSSGSPLAGAFACARRPFCHRFASICARLSFAPARLSLPPPFWPEAGKHPRSATSPSPPAVAVALPLLSPPPPRRRRHFATPSAPSIPPTSSILVQRACPLSEVGARASKP